MHFLLNCLGLAFAAMRQNKVRTAFSITGIVIGVSSVIVIGSVGHSGQDMIVKELETFGTRTLWVWRKWSDNPRVKERGGRAITNEDLDAIRQACPLVHRVSPLYQKHGPTWARRHAAFAPVQVQGVNEDFQFINSEEAVEGRFLVAADMPARRRVCLIAGDVRKTLFGDASPLGETIDFGLGSFEVIGVLKDKSHEMIMQLSDRAEPANNRVLIPYTVFQAKYHQQEIPSIQAEAVTPEQSKAASAQVQALLEQRHAWQFHYQDETMQQYIQTTNKVLGIAWWVAVVAAMISLAVGGIGIMNIMLSSVLERVREIGVRRAVGAKSRGILLQFLIEAVVISAVGGVIGLGIGVGITVMVAVVSKKPVALDWTFVVLGAGLAVAVGVASGAYPAWRAARLHPVEALRHE